VVPDSTGSATPACPCSRDVATREAEPAEWELYIFFEPKTPILPYFQDPVLLGLLHCSLNFGTLTSPQGEDASFAISVVSHDRCLPVTVDKYRRHQRSDVLNARSRTYLQTSRATAPDVDVEVAWSSRGSPSPHCTWVGSARSRPQTVAPTQLAHSPVSISARNFQTPADSAPVQLFPLACGNLH